MPDVSGAGSAASGRLPATSELQLSEERQAFLRPKLDAVLAQLRQLEELERLDLEPAPTMPRRWDNDERR